MFYDDLRDANYIKGTWQLYVDIVCDYCGKIHPLSSYYKCNACGMETKYGFAVMDDVPIAFENEEIANAFQEEYNSFIVAAELIGYDMKKSSVRNYVHGSNPKIRFVVTGNNNTIQFEIHISKSTECYSGYNGAIKYTSIVKRKEEPGKLIETRDFHKLFNHIKSNL